MGSRLIWLVCGLKGLSMLLFFVFLFRWVGVANAEKGFINLGNNIKKVVFKTTVLSLK